MTQEGVRICTIGFTQTSAKHFFHRLADADVSRMIDVRLNNTSQLAGFAKATDLAFFLKAISGIEYVHEPSLAPTEEILHAYKKLKGDWDTYAKRFLELMDKRQVDQALSPDFFHNGCMLCSEAKPHHCHRRLVAEYLKSRWSTPIVVQHL